MGESTKDFGPAKLYKCSQCGYRRFSLSEAPDCRKCGDGGVIMIEVPREITK